MEAWARKTRGIHRRGTRAVQPAATAVLNGTYYFVTDEFKLEQSNGTAWESATSKIAGGSTTEIQYNAAGILDGDPALVWDDVNKRLGLGIAAPEAPIHMDKDITNIAYFADSVNINHGITTLAPTSAFGAFVRGHPTRGGFIFRGFEDDGTVSPMKVDGFFGSTTPTKTIPAIIFRGFKKNGTTFQALAADETVFQVGNSTGTPVITVMGGGNLGINTSSFGTAAVAVLSIANGTAPTSSPAGVGQLYVEGGALKYRGTSDTITVIAGA